jgi:type II secretory pathway component PulF
MQRHDPQINKTRNFMTHFGWALVVSFALVIGTFRLFTRRSGKRLTSVQVLLPIPASFTLAAVLTVLWREVMLG